MSDAITRKEAYLKSIGDGTSSALKPITREEQYLAYIAGESNSFPTNPITREEAFLDKIAKRGAGGGGSSINVQPLTVTANGTFDAPEGQAYDPVTVNVKGGGSIIDVETLPTENIDANSVYRVTEAVVGEPEIYIVEEGYPTLNLADAFAEFWGVVGATVVINQVAELPEVMEEAKPDDKFMPVYIVESEGIGYMYTAMGPFPPEIATLGDALGYDNKGWSEDVASETENGIYCVRGKDYSVYHYHHYRNKEWVEFMPIVEVDELPADNIQDNTCYCVVDTNHSNKYFIYQNKKWVEWIENNGKELADFISGEGEGHLIIPSSVTKIVPYACYGRKYNEVTIPADVASIGEKAFYDCENLKTIHLGKHPDWNGILETFHPTTWLNSPCGILTPAITDAFDHNGIRYGLETRGDTPYYTSTSGGYFTETQKSIKFLSEINGIPVLKIAYSLENNNTVESVEIPNGITTLSYHAFWDCEALTTLIIPTSVTKFDQRQVLRSNSLEVITYLGTIEQWNAIEKADKWCHKDLIIRCTDGDIPFVWQ